MFRFTDLIILRVTRDCNLNCKYCFMKEKHLYKGEIIDFQLFKDIIEQITKQRIINKKQNDPLTLVLHGGEVLLLGKNKLEEMLSFASNYFNDNDIKHNFGTQTNATLLSDEIAAIFKKYNVGVGISFDGVEDSNDSRDIKQTTFQKKFNILNKNNIDPGFLVVLNKTNIDKFKKTSEYIREYQGNKNKRFKMSYAEDIDNPLDSKIEVKGSELFEKAYKVQIDQFIKYGYCSESNSQEMLDKSVIDIISNHDISRKSGCGTKFCGTAMMMIAVEPDGEMDCCDRFDRSYPEFHIQHALDYDFLALNQLKRAVQLNKKRHDVIIENKCDTCFADYICSHGCFSMYYSKFHSLGISTNLICDLSKNFYKYVLENIDVILNAYLVHEVDINSGDNILSIKNYYDNYFSENNISYDIQDDKYIKLKRKK